MPLAQVFVSVRDPRSARQVRHDLAELLTVAVCGVLCRADDFAEIEAWANERIDWLRGFLALENGIPSHDTFGRVFGLLDPREFEAAFRRWVGMVIPALGADQVVAIDGKTSRRSSNKADPNPLHLVSAFAAGVGVVLGQTATDEKSNEITAIPELLATLALQGCIVTLDAMGTQTDIARAIRAREADYGLCVKDNHPKLSESILLAQAGVGGKLKDVREALGPLDKKNVYYRDLPPELQEELWRRFLDGIDPLRQARRLGVLLFQVPPWFVPSRASFAHILDCQAHLPGFQLAIEFRNRTWLAPGRAADVMAFEREHGLAHVVVDEPQGFASSVPTLWEVTCPDIAVVRLHGRNTETWEGKGLQSSGARFNYLYGQDELKTLAGEVSSLSGRARRVHVLFNNNYEDYAQRNAMDFRRVMQEA